MPKRIFGGKLLRFANFDGCKVCMNLVKIDKPYASGETYFVYVMVDGAPRWWHSCPTLEDTERMFSWMHRHEMSPRYPLHSEGITPNYPKGE